LRYISFEKVNPKTLIIYESKKWKKIIQYDSSLEEFQGNQSGEKD